MSIQNLPFEVPSLKEGRSIKKTSNQHFYLLLGNLILIVGALLSLIFGQLKMGSLDRDFEHVIMKINSFMTSMSGAMDEDEVFEERFDDLIDLLKDSDPLLTKNMTLPPVFPADSRDRFHYFRTSNVIIAKALRKNLRTYAEFSADLNAVSIVLVFLCSSIAFINLLYWRRAQNLFLKEIEEGINTVEDLLSQNESELAGPEEYRLQESRIFIERISRIINDISHDRSIQDLSIHGNLEEVLRDLSGILGKRMDCHRIALAFIDSEGQITAETAFARYDDLHLRPGYTEALGSSSLGKMTGSRETRIISDLEDYIREKRATGGQPSPATVKILREGIRSSMTIPFHVNDRCVGFLFVSSRQVGAYDSGDRLYAERVFSLVKNKLYLEYVIQDIVAEISHAFTLLMSEKDNETSHHIRRMSEYSRIIAEEYARSRPEITQSFVREVFWYAPLHDIGKIGIPDQILLKPGRLDAGELEVMRTHVGIGERVLHDIDRRLSRYFPRQLMDTAVHIVKAHHEKYDGSGYPQGLEGEQIPLAGRIAAAADVFDALTSRRPYKEAYPVERSLRIMREDMDGSFDPEILNCLEAAMDRILSVYESYKEI